MYVQTQIEKVGEACISTYLYIHRIHVHVFMHVHVQCKYSIVPECFYSNYSFQDLRNVCITSEMSDENELKLFSH